jgi:hypothetical protein
VRGQALSRQTSRAVAGGGLVSGLHRPVARRLFRAGADVRKADSVGRCTTRARRVRRSNCCSCSSRLEPTSIARTPFFAACVSDAARQDTAFLEALFDVGASVCPPGNGFTPAHALATRPHELDCLRLLAERGVCATTSFAGRLPLFSAVRCLATFVWLHERGASLAESATAQIDLPLGSFENPHGTCGASEHTARCSDSQQRHRRCRVPAGQRRTDRRAGVDQVCSTRACVSAHAHATVRPLLRRFGDCGRGALARSAARSERRVVGAARVRCCVRRAGRQRVARIHPNAADASSASLSTRSIAAVRGMGLRIVEPRASEVCFASATDDAHHRRGVFIIKHFRFALNRSLNHNDVLFPRHLLLHSCRGTTRTVAAHCAHGSLRRSWFEQQTKKYFLLMKKKKTFFCSGCPPALCPRFAATAPCRGLIVTCSGNNATAL